MPPFDELQRPTTDEHGRQLAPETFVRWVAPAAWVDTDGEVHCDIPMFHRWLGWPETPESIRESAEIFAAILAHHRSEEPGEQPVFIIVR